MYVYDLEQTYAHLRDAGSHFPRIGLTMFRELKEESLRAGMSYGFDLCFRGLFEAVVPSSFERAPRSLPELPTLSYECELYRTGGCEEGCCVAPAEGMEMSECAGVSMQAGSQHSRVSTDFILVYISST